MSGPQGYDPEQPWSGQQEPPGSGEPTIGETWQQPAYTPPPFGQTEQYPSTGPEYQQPYSEAEQAGQQPTQYGPTQYGQPEQFQPTQYGQYSPGGEAYAPTGQYTPPGSQFGEAPAFGAPETAKGSKRSMGTLIGIIGLLALVVILAGVAVTGFWKPGYFWTTKLDVNAAQAGVEKVLTDEVNGYGRKNVTGVKCNDGANPTVEKGDTFTCDASVDGEHKQVTVTFKDDTGTYEVGRPT